MCIDTMGRILQEGWLMKCKLAPNITSPFISSAYQTAISSGALGGKISGAGGGGFLNVIVSEKKQLSVISALEKLGLRNFPIKPDTEGTSVTRIY